MQTVEPGVTSGPGQKLLVGAGFNDPSFVHHEYSIGDTQGRETVRNENRRPPPRKLVKPAEQLILRLGT